MTTPSGRAEAALKHLVGWLAEHKRGYSEHQAAVLLSEVEELVKPHKRAFRAVVELGVFKSEDAAQAALDRAARSIAPGGEVLMMYEDVAASDHVTGGGL